jgi:hypothetical protein
VLSVSDFRVISRFLSQLLVLAAELKSWCADHDLCLCRCLKRQSDLSTRVLCSAHLCSTAQKGTDIFPSSWCALAPIRIFAQLAFFKQSSGLPPVPLWWWSVSLRNPAQQTPVMRPHSIRTEM